MSNRLGSLRRTASDYSRELPLTTQSNRLGSLRRTASDYSCDWRRIVWAAGVGSFRRSPRTVWTTGVGPRRTTSDHVGPFTGPYRIIPDILLIPTNRTNANFVDLASNENHFDDVEAGESRKNDSHYPIRRKPSRIKPID